MKEKSGDGWKIACVIGLFALKIHLLCAKIVEKWNLFHKIRRKILSSPEGKFHKWNWILLRKTRRKKEWKHTSRNL